ncbi:4Fe-4S ferredoxin [Desulfonema ishimotonii]|uniref:4Fe-4S ferredoxin n=1 Tax=Desulfonema ishimotonii TaxID=45657 RepID=A0A401G250_9BACT|nr:4Fe-4S dicluster domain-containing protein [Desulfonema ishimotonii]GBC63251.1 4Fe-4S ferredoxin [Desulfonema ishimotonii]
MESSRRNFLKVAGISALGVGTKPVAGVFAASGGDHGDGQAVEMGRGEKALTAKHWGMVIDTRKLKTAEDLEPLIEVCHVTHNVPVYENKRHEIKWIWETEYKHAFPGKGNKYLNETAEHTPFLVLCNHCENPPCCRACPTEATFQREDGIVLMDFHRCIGCRFCMAACPFGARSFNFLDPRPFIHETNKKFPTRMKGVVEKCNFCAERLAVGQLPACVEASKGAIAFGDLDDAESEVRKLLKENYTIRRKQTLGTEPSVYYIV